MRCLSAQLSGGPTANARHRARVVYGKPEACYFDENRPRRLIPSLNKRSVKVIQGSGRRRGGTMNDRNPLIMKTGADCVGPRLFLHSGLSKNKGAPDVLFGAPNRKNRLGAGSSRHPRRLKTELKTINWETSKMKNHRSCHCRTALSTVSPLADAHGKPSAWDEGATLPINFSERCWRSRTALSAKSRPSCCARSRS